MFLNSEIITEIADKAFDLMISKYKNIEFDEVETCAVCVANNRNYETEAEYVNATVALYELSLEEDDLLDNLINRITCFDAGTADVNR